MIFCLYINFRSCDSP